MTSGCGLLMAEGKVNQKADIQPPSSDVYMKLKGYFMPYSVIAWTVSKPMGEEMYVCVHCSYGVSMAHGTQKFTAYSDQHEGDMGVCPI